MVDTVSRLRVGSKIFETMVDLDSAMKFKKGEEIDVNEIIRDNSIWHDLKKGLHAGASDLKEAFGTDELAEVVKKIVKKGEIEETQEHRDAETEQRRKQVIDYLVRNSVDARTGMPFTPDTIDSALKQAGAKIDKQPVDRQIKSITSDLTKIIPIKIETKKVKVIIPAMHTGKAYGIIQEYKETENWLGNGDLEVILNIPVGIQTEFYDKLNGVTHGSALTEELKEE